MSAPDTVTLAGEHRPGPAAHEQAVLAWLLDRAARDGHTAQRADVVLRALAALDVGDPAAALHAAAAAGVVLAPAEGEPGAGLVAGAALAAAEDAVAEHLERLLLTVEPAQPAPPAGPAGAALGGVTVVLGCCATARRGVLAELAEGAGAPGGPVVLDDAHRLDVPAAAELLEPVPDGARLVLAGDVEALPAAGPGDVLADLAGSGAAPVRQASCPDAQVAAQAGPVSTPAQLAHAVRAGRLPAVESPDRAVVAVPTDDDAACVRRVVQLVTISIPRAFGVPAGEVLVVTPLRRGVAGASALSEALAVARGRDEGWTPRVSTVAEAAATQADAVVAVLPAEAAGVLSRPLVQAAAAPALRHLSVVSAAGPALPAAVASVVRRPRTTRLVDLLRASVLA